ncbi:CarD family transcriptional regulator [Streptomyces sp. NPDC049687]|uniref:CarD family transcriptional regulator n=1 Tax=Streptomyces sp. NPDC049687 TaxID=3365596 RepID=UPI0037B10167
MTKSAAPKRHLPTSPFKAPIPPPLKQFAVGDQVTHDMHGLGRVIGIEEGIAALVDFGSTQERILSPYAKMSKL